MTRKLEKRLKIVDSVTEVHALTVRSIFRYIHKLVLGDVQISVTDTRNLQYCPSLQISVVRTIQIFHWV